MMPALTSILLASALATSATSTVMQIKNANDARNDAEAQGKKQEDAQNKLLADQKAQKDQYNQGIVQNQQAAVTQSIARAAATSTRSGTIATSPLGIPGAAPTTGKSVLGG